jgi:hypothetical protein
MVSGLATQAIPFESFTELAATVRQAPVTLLAANCEYAFTF